MLLALALLIAVGPPTQNKEDSASPAPALAATSRDTWSEFGYLQLRWGMGPSDVTAALRSGEMRVGGPLKISKAGRLAEYEGALVDFSILGYDTKKIVFSFVDDALYRITLEPALPSNSDAWLDWAAKMIPALKGKYGDPADTKINKTIVMAVWRPDGDLVTIAAAPAYATIQHGSPHFAAKAYEVRRSIERDSVPDRNKL